MIKPAMQNGLTGMQIAYQGMTQSAGDIARLNTQPLNTHTGDASDINAALTGYAQPLLELRMNQTLFDASARVVSASDTMVGALLDMTV